MYDASEKLIEFTSDNLAEKIGNVVPIDEERLKYEIKEYIWPRLDFLSGGKNGTKRYFIFEENYIETEWKDMISIHYINTSYWVNNAVMRIHIFIEKRISETNYAGFFTLRKIDEPRMMLSYIYPNWSVISYESRPVCAMTYRKTVHIAGNTISFPTYPLFVQDNITVACAQASMVAMTQYLHHKFDYKKIRIKELGNAFFSGKTKLFPSAGLLPTQMIEIFNYYDIPIDYKAFNMKNDLSREEEEGEYERYRQYIDYSIESGIPVILGIAITEVDNKKNIQKRHILQIIGHTAQNRKMYVVYDDSGCFLKDLNAQNGFVVPVDWNDLKRYIKNRNSFIIFPIHEKVYLLLDDFKNIFCEMYNKISTLRQLTDDKMASLEKTRYFLADNRDVKAFVKQNVYNIPEIEEEIKDLLNRNMAHFVWCAEVPVRNGYIFYLADPTYGKLTTKNIFYNTIPLFSKKQFGILNYK